jgi:hypothetical protein
MKAPKMSQTVLLEKPLNPHSTDPEGESETSPKMIPRVIPIKPIAAEGNGSNISPKIIEVKSAKKYQAFAVKPDGAGISEIQIPANIGIKIFNLFIIINIAHEFIHGKEK